MRPDRSRTWGIVPPGIRLARSSVQVGRRLTSGSPRLDDHHPPNSPWVSVVLLVFMATHRLPNGGTLHLMPDVVSAQSVFGDEWTDAGDLLELLAARRPAWHADAACREAPASVSWFIERGQDPRPAKAVCARCLVLDDCRAWVLEQGPDLDGVWAGLSRADRAEARRGVAA